MLIGRFLDKRKPFWHHFTGFTNMNFVFPFFMSISGADCAIYKPAQFPCLEFPGRAVIFEVLRALFNNPALLGRIHFCKNPGYHKQQLSFNVRRYRTPTLFIAVHCFYGYTQKLRHLRLGFAEFFAETYKRISFHSNFLNLFLSSTLRISNTTL